MRTKDLEEVEALILMRFLQAARGEIVELGVAAHGLNEHKQVSTGSFLLLPQVE